MQIAIIIFRHRTRLDNVFLGHHHYLRSFHRVWSLMRWSDQQKGIKGLQKRPLGYPPDKPRLRSNYLSTMVFLAVLAALAVPAFSSIITARDDASVAVQDPTSSWTPAWTWYGSGKQCPSDVSKDCPCLTDVRSELVPPNSQYLTCFCLVRVRIPVPPAVAGH